MQASAWHGGVVEGQACQDVSLLQSRTVMHDGIVVKDCDGCIVIIEVAKVLITNDITLDGDDLTCDQIESLIRVLSTVMDQRL